MAKHMYGRGQHGQLLNRARKQGFRVTPSRNGHLLIFGPDGQLAATTGSTPSDGRAWLNLRGHLRRAGYVGN